MPDVSKRCTTNRQQNRTSQPAVGQAKGWEELYLFEKRCQATKEWNYDLINQELLNDGEVYLISI